MSILIKPIITEKATDMSELSNCFSFVVKKGANKIEVKEAVEALEAYLISKKAIPNPEVARKLAEFVIDIIDAAKQEQNDEVDDDGYPSMDGGRP